MAESKFSLSLILFPDGVKNGFSFDYGFVLQNLLSFSEWEIKPADEVLTKQSWTNVNILLCYG